MARQLPQNDVIRVTNDVIRDAAQRHRRLGNSDDVRQLTVVTCAMQLIHRFDHGLF